MDHFYRALKQLLVIVGYYLVIQTSDEEHDLDHKGFSLTSNIVMRKKMSIQ